MYFCFCGAYRYAIRRTLRRYVQRTYAPFFLLMHDWLHNYITLSLLCFIILHFYTLFINHLVF